MAIEIIYPDGTRRVIPGATRAKYNHLKGAYDLYDRRGEVVGEAPARDKPELRPADEPRDEGRGRRRPILARFVASRKQRAIGRLSSEQLAGVSVGAQKPVARGHVTGMREERPARVRVDIEVRAWPAHDHWAVVRDISLSGCLLVTAARLKQTQGLLLAIPLAGGGELRLAGTVVRWHEGRGGGGYGVRFGAMADEQRRALELVVAGGGERPPAAA